MPDLDYQGVQILTRDFQDPHRNMSAAFLVWYLRHYYRLDALQAIDCVCDAHGDRGVDGIYVNDDDATIEVFQCKLVQDPGRTIGDSQLREFCGTLAQFGGQDAVERLIASAGQAEVARLARRLGLPDAVKTHTVRGVFIANTEMDANGAAYLQTVPYIEFVGRAAMESAYVPESRTVPRFGPAQFDVSGHSVAEYCVDANTKALIAAVKARDLVRLDGIRDQSLFAFNVRGSLGRTQVNRDIRDSIRDAALHPLFPLFHNGITVICDRMESNSDAITVEGYYVVNGCQSLNALYSNQDHITDNLRILAKFVRLDQGSPLAEQVTRYSNNQNSVRPRDFKANDPIQIRLQNEFREHYCDVYTYSIKRGEPSEGGEAISNEQAGLYLWSFDLKEPWATHRAYQVFDQKYADVFARPAVTADRIVALHELMRCISDQKDRIENTLLGKYVLTGYAVLFMLRTILEAEDAGRELIEEPQRFVRTASHRQWLHSCIAALVADVIVDLNAEVSQYGAEFAYRDHLRDQVWIKRVTSEVAGNYRKLVQRGRVEAFSSQWRRLATS